MVASPMPALPGWAIRGCSCGTVKANGGQPRRLTLAMDEAVELVLEDFALGRESRGGRKARQEERSEEEEIR